MACGVLSYLTDGGVSRTILGIGAVLLFYGLYLLNENR